MKYTYDTFNSFTIYHPPKHSHLPMAVQARPITTPGGVSSYNRSEVNIGLPTKSVRLSGFTSNVSLSLLTILYAAFLNT